MHGDAANPTGNIADLSTTTFDPTSDWTLSFTARRQGSDVNLDSAMYIQVGSQVSGDVGAALNFGFAVGDNALDQCTALTIYDSTGTLASLGPIQFTAGTNVPVVMQRSGSQLIITIDGVVIGSFAATLGVHTDPDVLVESFPDGNAIVAVYDDFLLTTP
jgi:hypothetical protein